MAAAQHPLLLPEPSTLLSSTEALPSAGNMGKKVIADPGNGSGVVRSLLETDWLFRFCQLPKTGCFRLTSPSLLSSLTALTTLPKEADGAQESCSVGDGSSAFSRRQATCVFFPLTRTGVLCPARALASLTKRTFKTVNKKKKKKEEKRPGFSSADSDFIIVRGQGQRVGQLKSRPAGSHVQPGLDREALPVWGCPGWQGTVMERHQAEQQTEAPAFISGLLSEKQSV